MAYPTSVTTFTSRNAGDVIQPSHVNDLQTEVNQIEAALLTTGLAHHLLFVDATYDIGQSGATRPRHLFMSGNATIGGTVAITGAVTLSGTLETGGNITRASGNDQSFVVSSNRDFIFSDGAELARITGSGPILFINDTANAEMTTGLTINQGAADNEILALKSSDINHGITAVTETDTYGLAKKLAATNGGVLLRGLSAGEIGFKTDGIVTTGSTTKTTAANAAVFVNALLKSGTGVTGLGANENIAAFATNDTVRFILDADGDSHQDVGTAWTNFDDRDDVLTLTALSAAVSRDGDPVRQAFAHLIDENREALEAAKLVTFNADGHHFINWSRTMMLAIGAIRQQGQQIAALCAHLGLPPTHGVKVLGAR